MTEPNLTFSLSLRSGKKIKKGTSGAGDSDDSESESVKPDFPISNNTSEIMTLTNNADNSAANISNTVSSFNLSNAIKLIPEFDGDPSQLHRFLQIAKIQYSRAVNDCHKLEFLDLIKSKLTGRAYNSILRYNDYDSWEELRAALRKQFSKERSIQIIQTELFAAKQEAKENVNSYADRIERLLDELNISSSRGQSSEGSKAIRAVNEQTAINNFKTGLRNPLKLILKSTRHDTLREAIDMAIDEERLLEADNKREVHSNFTRRGCAYCRNANHETKDCRKNQNRVHLQNPSTSKFPSFNKNQVAHINSDYRSKFCRYCKNKGHEIHECRKRQYVNSRNMTTNTNSQVISNPENEEKPGRNGATARAQNLK